MGEEEHCHQSRLGGEDGHHLGEDGHHLGEDGKILARMVP